MATYNISAEPMPDGVLLRLSFGEPTIDRQELPPCTELHILPRYRFRGKGTDSVTCAWHVWLRGPDGWIQRGVRVSPRPKRVGTERQEEERAGLLGCAANGAL